MTRLRLNFLAKVTQLESGKGRIQSSSLDDFRYLLSQREES